MYVVAPTRAALAVDEELRELDRFMRQPPTSFTESAATREAIERVNRATRTRRALVVSTLD